MGKRIIFISLLILLCGSLSFAQVPSNSSKEKDFRTKIDSLMADLKAKTERAAQRIKQAQANMRSSWEKSRRNRDAAKSFKQRQKDLPQNRSAGNNHFSFQNHSNAQKQADTRNKIREANDKVDRQNQKTKASMAQARSRNRDNSRALKTQLRQR